MATVIDSHVTSEKDGYPYDQVEYCTESLFKAISIIERRAKPKQFHMNSCRLLRFDSVPANGRRHQVRVVGEELIDEIYVWQVIGTIGGRIVNIVSEYTFHTHKNNRSGSGEWYVNGKDAYLRADMGGLAISAIWQDATMWKVAYDNAVAKELIEVGDK